MKKIEAMEKLRDEIQELINEGTPTTDGYIKEYCSNGVWYYEKRSEKYIKPKLEYYKEQLNYLNRLIIDEKIKLLEKEDE